jgi:hypothetical protein
MKLPSLVSPGLMNGIERMEGNVAGNVGCQEVKAGLGKLLPLGGAELRPGLHVFVIDRLGNSRRVIPEYV